ncbi:hypothetical protein cypCar_00017455 [Cyprinus carpio]|nr:hypothetical protein cypCar_00017455 [Cyprinus carpio]
MALHLWAWTQRTETNPRTSRYTIIVHHQHPALMLLRTICPLVLVKSMRCQ